MRLSIITPTYNEEKNILKCLESVDQQTFRDFEHIIIDNESVDSTVNIIKKIQSNNNNIKVFTQKDKGIYDAMNIGISKSSGEWIYFLGADDTLYNQFIFEEIFSNNLTEKYDFIYGNVKWGDSDIIFDGKFSEVKLINHNICHQAIFYRKEIFNIIGMFEIEYDVWADWLFNIKCFNNDEIRKIFINKIVANFSLGGFSSKKKKDFLFINQREDLFKTLFSKELIYLLNEPKLLKNLYENSTSFRLGKFLLFPFILISKILKNIR